MRIKIYGGPGTGKTRTLHRLVDLMYWGSYRAYEELKAKNFPEEFLDSVKAKYELRDIAFITLQNSALQELVGRLGYDIHRDRGKKGPIRYFRTIHGLCFILLHEHGIISEEQIKRTILEGSVEEHFMRFCEKQGIKFDPELMGVVHRFYLGNLLWQKMGEVINKYYPTLGHKAKDKLIEELETMDPVLLSYYREWIKYKEKKGIIDYNDMLTMAYDHLKNGDIELPTKVLLVDEFQDFSPLQYEIFELLSKDKDHVIVAGDDWQTIFSWLGSTPRFLLEWKADHEVVLRVSHRLPRKVLYLALRYAKEQFVEQKYKLLAPRNFTGAIGYIVSWNMRNGTHVDRLANIVKNELKRGHSVFILTRTNPQALRLIRKFILRGFSPRMLKEGHKWAQRKRIGEVAISFYDIIRAIQGVLAKTPTNKDIQVLSAITGGTGKISLDILEDLSQITQKIDFELIRRFWGKEAQRLTLELLETEIKEKHEGELYIDTIHASKGREADIVFLINEMPRRNWKKFIVTQEDLEVEKRVWFVGLTRAKKALGVLYHPYKAFPIPLEYIEGVSREVRIGPM